MAHEAATTFLESFMVRIYQPPLVALRNELHDLPVVLRTVVLVIDFSTEIAQEGIAGFLENSTGQFLPETVTALQTIGALETAEALAVVRDLLAHSPAAAQETARHSALSNGEADELLMPYVTDHLEELQDSVSHYQTKYGS